MIRLAAMLRMHALCYLCILLVTLRLTAAGQQPNQEQCQSLLNVGSCLPWGNCSGLQCPGGGSIVVFKCQDPVVVQLTVNSTTRNITQSSLYTDNNGAVAVSIRRDNNNLFFNATVNGDVAVPNVAVPLNTSDCACRSLQQFSADAQSAAALQLSCSTNQQCTGVRCVPTLASLFGVDMTVLPCRSPPAVQISLVDTSGYAVLYNGTFDRSQNVSVSPLLTLSVDITQRQYSMDVGVSVTTPLYGTIPIFGKRTIILDKSTCSLPPAPANPTCQALQNLRSRLPLCSLNQACNGLNCAVLGAPYTVAFEVEPCNEPPSILLTVRDPSGAVVYNSSVNNSTVISLGANVRLSVVLRQLDSAIALKVDMLTPSGTINLVPFYVIPIDESECDFGSGSGAPFNPSPPQYPTQCEAFRGIGNSTSSCTANPACDGVTCALPGGLVTRIGILPCNTPPALSLTIAYGNGTVLFSRVIDQSQQVPLLGGSTLLVTVDQLPSAIGFQMYLQTLLGTRNIIPYTIIPYNTTNCRPTQVPPTLSPQPSSTCAALNSIASSQPLCVTNSACDEIDCSVQGYTTAMTVLPCNSPPAIRLTVFSPSGATVYSQTLSQSRQVPLLGGALTLQVTVDQLASSLGIQLDVATPFGTGTIVPYTVVPLNTSSCPPTQAPPTSSPGTTTCTALYSVTSSNPACSTNQACDKLTCTTLGLSTGFRVLPCNSPPSILVSVNNSNGTVIYSESLSRSQLVPLVGGAVTLVVTVDQLNNSLGLRVDAISAFGGSVNIVPYAVIPLNNSNCGPTQATPTNTPLPTSTCSALQSILIAGSSSCSVRPLCDEVDCAVLGYSTGFIVLPCNSPPAVAVIVNGSANNTLFYQVVSQSQKITLFGVTALDITVIQLKNSLGFKVDVIPLPGTRVSLIPYTVIPLNTSNCGPTRAPPTSTPPTTTCGALNTITALNGACTPTPACEGVDCSYLNYTIAVGVLPCSTPPAVQLNVFGPTRTALYSQTLSQSQSVPVLAGFLSLYVTVVQLRGSIGVKVDATTPLGTSNIIPYTVIPLNTSGCVYTPTQVPTPPLPDTCSALKSIATAGQSCSATALCDGVDCQYPPYRISMRLLPCSSPPSIRLTAYNSKTGQILYNQTLSQSQQIMLINNVVTLNVTLLQQRNAIALKVDLILITGTRINVIPYTVIPISTAGCSNSPQGPTRPASSSSTRPQTSSFTPTTSSTSPNGGATQAQGGGESARQAAIAVPVSIILALLVVAVVVVVVVVVVRKYRKRKALYDPPFTIQGINMGDYNLTEGK